VIPLAASLKKDGAHKSSVLAFLVSAPTTGVDSIFATYSLMGPLFALFRPLAAIVAGITLGLVDYWFGDKAEEKEFTYEKISPAKKYSWRDFLQYSFVQMPGDIGKWLVWGTLIGAGVAVILPQDIFTHYLIFPFDFIVAIGAGIPMYVCATGSIPIAAAFIMKGISPGAALAFLIAGPATNMVALAFVRASLGRRSFWLYLFSIVATAFIFGIIFNRVWGYTQIYFPQSHHSGKDILPGSIKIISAVILALLVFGNNLKSRFGQKPSSCPHCCGKKV
jgi:hypothetical protein